MAAEPRFRFPLLAGLAAIALPEATSADPNTASARTTARIERPALLRNGRVIHDAQPVQRRVTERPCVPGDAPERKPCRLIVTDLE